MVGRYVRRPVMLGSVDEPGRQCDPSLGIGKYNGFCAERSKHLDHKIRLLQSDAQSFDVIDRTHRPFDRVKRPCSRFKKCEPDKSVRFEALQYLVADWTV